MKEYCANVTIWWTKNEGDEVERFFIIAFCEARDEDSARTELINRAREQLTAQVGDYNEHRVTFNNLSEVFLDPRSPEERDY